VRKVFWISFCVIFAGQELFQIHYLDFGVESLCLYAIIAVLAATGSGLAWKQFKRI
jgi:hypothetical protein